MGRFKKTKDKGLRLAIREAGKRTNAAPKFWTRNGKNFLAEGLGITVQAIDQWNHIPKNRVMMVHHLTGVPLKILAPKLFKE